MLKHVRDLKSEFQHVEEKMRLAVESLHYPERLNPGLSQSGPEAWALDQSGDGDSGRWSVSSSDRGYYPGKFTERMERMEAASPSLSTVSSPTYPFSVSGRSSPGPAHAQLSHSETYTLIPVERAGARRRTELWRMQLASWTLR